MFTDIKVIIWDFDGTLYKMKPELSNALRQAELDTIALHKKWPKEKILAEFEKLHKTLSSATATVAQISGISTSQAAFESESLFDRRDYLEKDDKIVSLFQSLPTVMHVLLTNGYSTFIKEAIIKLEKGESYYATCSIL